MQRNNFFGFKQDGDWCSDFGVKILECSREFKPITVLSLFSGAGGLDIGFHEAGFKIVSSVEIEKDFAETLNENQGSFFSSTVVHCKSVADYKPELDSVDFIIGGPPCQSFSAAGARFMGTMGMKDERGRLFLEYVRLLTELRPKGFLFENVPRIVSSNKGSDWVTHSNP